MHSFPEQRSKHTDLDAEGALHRSLLLTNGRERSFHSTGALFIITLVVVNGCNVEICMPFKKSPVSKPSLWEDYGWKNGGSERWNANALQVLITDP